MDDSTDGDGFPAYAVIDTPSSRIYINSVAITFDPEKRRRTLKERGLDFADAEEMFDSSDYVTVEDNRQDYREPRFRTAGYLAGRLVVIVWTPRDGARRIFSMRHAHDDEERRWRDLMDRS